ncbi:MAG: hypothetical protein J2O48_06260 [Solirubrobacterales bacterium]|nr:hypothetical protein [Solirubrobacterales bacterium]
MVHDEEGPRAKHTSKADANDDGHDNDAPKSDDDSATKYSDACPNPRPYMSVQDAGPWDAVGSAAFCSATRKCFALRWSYNDGAVAGVKHKPPSSAQRGLRVSGSGNAARRSPRGEESPERQHEATDVHGHRDAKG